jgi:hypothetical protein
LNIKPPTKKKKGRVRAGRRTRQRNIAGHDILITDWDDEPTTDAFVATPVRRTPAEEGLRRAREELNRNFQAQLEAAARAVGTTTGTGDDE